jgi:probable LLM family oxidoreductase
MEIGISTFGEVTPERGFGSAKLAHQRVQELLEHARVADDAGLDVYALGEHHRSDYVVSSPEVVLSAVTVLSSVDPVRTYQQFSTLDLVSSGRAEILAGRGSFIESFPLFGYDLADYNALFEEKLQLLLQINEKERITWQGKFRSGLQSQAIYPRPIQEKLPIWLGVGGTPTSAIRAAKLKLPMMIAILGGMPKQFLPLVQLYRKTAQEAGQDLNTLPLGVNLHFHVAETSQQAAEELYPTYARMMNRIGQERGWAPLTRPQFEQMRSPEGSLLVGSVDEVVDKLVYIYQTLGNTRYLAQQISGAIPHEAILRSTELLGKVVAPKVRERIAML